MGLEQIVRADAWDSGCLSQACRSRGRDATPRSCPRGACLQSVQPPGSLDVREHKVAPRQLEPVHVLSDDCQFERLGQADAPQLARHFFGDKVAGLEWSCEDGAWAALRGRRCSSPGPERFAESRTSVELPHRQQHGCKGAHVFRDPNESDRVWAIFHWDEQGWQSFTSDPAVPAIFQEAGSTQGPPKSAEFVRDDYA